MSTVYIVTRYTLMTTNIEHAGTSFSKAKKAAKNLMDNEPFLKRAYRNKSKWEQHHRPYYWRNSANAFSSICIDRYVDGTRLDWDKEKS